jgi:hypothetical protein
MPLGHCFLPLLPTPVSDVVWLLGRDLLLEDGSGDGVGDVVPFALLLPAPLSPGSVVVTPGGMEKWPVPLLPLLLLLLILSSDFLFSRVDVDEEPDAPAAPAATGSGKADWLGGISMERLW